MSAQPYANIYGLTGVIGSGKSTVAKLFAGLGAYVIDADALARDVVHPQSLYYAELRAKLISRFASQTNGDLFSADGSLNRALLGRLVFGDAEKVAALNAIMHPAIQREFAARVAQAGTKRVVIYDVPLLFEGGLDKELKATIVAYAPEQICIERAVRRAAQKGEHVPADAVLARLKSQISIEEKRRRADYIIDNSGDESALKPQVEAVYRKLAAQ